MALKGHGATLRCATLPHESHRYLARESVFHTVAETLNWFEQVREGRHIEDDDRFGGGPVMAANPAAGTGPGLVSLDRIRDARERIRGVARVTPLVEAPAESSARLYLKCESLQPGGAFKIRGAYNMIAQLAPAERDRGVVTYSSGNHGQAVALAARALGARAVVVMPTTAPAIKIERTRTFGAEVIFAGTTSADRRVRAEAEVAARGLTMVPPFDHEWIIAGQGTAGLEILEQQPDVAAVIVPIGGGGLIAGVAAAIKQSRPGVRIIGVEPVGAAAMKASIAAGHPVSLPKTESIADGLMPVRPGDLTFAHVHAFVDAILAISDDDIVSAVLWLFASAKLVVEPSGAATVAAALSGAAERELTSDGPVVAIVSGGNIAVDTLAALSHQTATRSS